MAYPFLIFSEFCRDVLDYNVEYYFNILEVCPRNVQPHLNMHIGDVQENGIF